MELSKRQRRLAAQKELKKAVTKFEQIDLSACLSKNGSKVIPDGMTRAYRNSRYTVMVFDNSPVSTGTAVRAMIQAHDGLPIKNHWSEIQKIKNEIFGEHITAVEYYPSEFHLVDYYNIYWIWIFPLGVLPVPIMPNN